MKRFVPIAAASYGLLQLLGRTSGSSTAERCRQLPGDEIVKTPMVVTNHAVTIDAPTEAVWPWLVQVGWRRGGWYTARWVDQVFFPANRPSADRILPQFQGLDVGDSVPDGPPESGCGFVVEELQPRHHIVLHSRSHLPRLLMERGAWLDWTWVFVVDDLGPDRSRLLVRSRVRLGPRWLALAYRLVLVPADFVMARQMLRGIAARAEHRHAALAGGPRVPLRRRVVAETS